MKRIVLLILIITFANCGFTQNNLNYKYIDSLSYNLYLKSDWSGVVKIAKKAINQNIDYYYLRMRLGIAYYESKQYIKAIPNFKKALEYKTDTIAIEYLYYSYLFSGKYFDALIFKNQQTENIKKKLKFGYKKTNLIFDYQYADNNNYKPIVFEQDIYDQYIITNEKYFDVGLSNLSSNRTYLKFLISHYTSLLTHNYQDNIIGVKNNNTNISETSIYGGALVHISRNIELSTYTNFIFGKKMPQFDSQKSFQTSTQSYMIPINSLNLSYNISNFNFDVNGAISRADSGLLYYPSLEIKYLPLYNPKFTIYAKLEYLNNTRLKYNFTKPVYSFGFIVNLFKKIYINTNYKIINSKYYIEQQGFIIYNGNELKNKFLSELDINFNRIDIFARYQYINLKGSYNLNTNLFNYYYINQTILGGITWKF